MFVFFFNDTATTEIYTLSLHDALPISLAEALRPDVLLVWAMNGAPLPPQHGAPLRLLVPGWYGMAHVKWLTRVEVLDRPFHGFQNAVAYRLKVEDRKSVV